MQLGQCVHLELKISPIVVELSCCHFATENFCWGAFGPTGQLKGAGRNFGTKSIILNP